MNAVKYAYAAGAGPIHVDLNAQGDDLVLSISDEGVGLNAKSDPRSTGMGQRIVSTMAAKLEASVERDPDHAGTRIVLRFRHAKPAAKTANAAASQANWWPYAHRARRRTQPSPPPLTSP